MWVDGRTLTIKEKDRLIETIHVLKDQQETFKKSFDQVRSATEAVPVALKELENLKERLEVVSKENERIKKDKFLKVEVLKEMIAQKNEEIKQLKEENKQIMALLHHAK